MKSERNLPFYHSHKWNNILMKTLGKENQEKQENK